MNEGHNVIKSNFDRSPARRMVFVFLFLGKRKFSCTSSTRRFIFKRCYGPKKIFVCRTPGHIRILYQQQNNSVITWTHFSPITPDKIIYHRRVGNGLFVYTKLSNRRSQEVDLSEFWMPTVWLLRSSLRNAHRLFTCRNLKVQGENATIKNEKENDVLKKVIAKKIWLRVKF